MSAGTGFTGVVLDGRYQLAERLGVGGVAEVYRGEDLALGRSVAVKLLHSGADAAGSAHERLRSEVRLLARLSHPGLASVYDTGQHSGRAFLVMQLVDGGTLADSLVAGPLPTSGVVEVGTGLADVLAYLHAQDLVHRDLKPSNVMLDSTGRVFLTDFGIARVVDATRMTTTNAAIGTATYMAPEQVQGHSVGPPADIYALGLVLIECLTGRPAYEGGNSFEVAMARLHTSPPIPSGGLPAPLPGLLEAMTDRVPDRRPTAEQMAPQLRGVATPTPDRSDQAGPRATAVLPAPSATAGRSGLALSGAGDGPRALWRRARARSIAGLRMTTVIGLVVLAAVLIGGLTLLALPDDPAGPKPLSPPTAPPGSDRLPEDLDRLEREVSP